MTVMSLAMGVGETPIIVLPVLLPTIILAMVTSPVAKIVSPISLKIPTTRAAPPALTDAAHAPCLS